MAEVKFFEKTYRPYSRFTTNSQLKLNYQRKLLEQALDKYRSELNLIPDAQFDVTPPAGGWSYAEVYAHILQADYGSLIAAEKCARKTVGTTTKHANILGWIVLTSGSFPPIKFKAPPAPAYAVKKISKEDARNLLIKVRARLESVMEIIKDAPEDYRIKHPRLGMLNAKQWLKFTRIHSEHHLKQLKRIRKSF